MWVKTTCCSRLCLLLIIRKFCLQFCTGADLYQYAGFYLQKAATFSHFPATTRRELQPPSSCTSRYVCLVRRRRPTEGYDLLFFFQGPCFINFQTRSINNIISVIQTSNISASTNHLLNQPQQN